LDLEELRRHPAILRRVDEFWSDSPDERVIRETGLQDHPLLSTVRASADAPIEIDESQLTLKEQRLWEALSLHAGEVCEKDQLIQYIWPEDVIFEQGIRDESLAQLVRRLRLKIERDPANPQLIQTVPGRGYILRERLK
jgi:DNA-binding response OmpR family regulator